MPTKTKSVMPASPNRGRFLAVVAIVLVLIPAATFGASGARAAALDPGFGEGGIVLTRSLPDGGIHGIAQDRAGRLVAVGENLDPRFTALRFLADGSLDPSFGSGKTAGRGYVETEFRLESEAEALATLPKGGFLAVGTATRKGSGQFDLARYREDGSLDPGFGNGGLVQTHTGVEGGGALAVAVQRGRRILVGGYGIDAARHWRGMLVAYRLDGSMDRSFGKQGQIFFRARGRTRAAITGIAVLPSGKVLLGGDVAGRFLLVRLLPNGRRDRSFGGGDGVVIADVDGARHCSCTTSRALSPAPRGRILMIGHGEGGGLGSAIVTRFLPNGKPDESFGRHGIATRRSGRFSFSAVLARPGGGVVVAGSILPAGSSRQQAVVLQLLPDGDPDQSFGASGVFGFPIGEESATSSLLLEPDGKLVVAGYAKLHPPRFPELRMALDGASNLVMRLTQ
jgi:uncharacterized delta-60 repeat protein